MYGNLEYRYFKLRKNFGHEPLFCETAPVLLDTILPDKSMQDMYCLRNPVHEATQVSKSFSEHDANTIKVEHENRGINHLEGGWPKEIDCEDDEATKKYRYKYERNNDYVSAVLDNFDTFTHYVDQNNAIEMYNLYFNDMKPQPPPEKNVIKIANLYADEQQRPISGISWSSEKTQLAVSYCNKRYPAVGPANDDYSGYVWDLVHSKKLATFSPPSPCWQVLCVPKCPNLIVGGLEDGRVCLFDLRAKQEPIAVCLKYYAHREAVSSLIYTHSRVTAEICSGSTEGRCLWWDIRNLNIPLESLIISIDDPHEEPMDLANTEGVSFLNHSKLIPTIYLCGTVSGFVININKKFKNYNQLMSTYHKAHYGPVKSINRCLFSNKIFITCGDFTTHIWHEDFLQGPFITGTPHKHQINDVVWAPQRVSSFMSVCADGILRYWDLLRRYREPIYTLCVSKNELLKVLPHHEGQMVVTGDIKGNLCVLLLSENLAVSAADDKQKISQFLDREGRRERILDTQMKIRETKRDKRDEDNLDAISIKPEYDELREAEVTYKRTVLAELQRLGKFRLSVTPSKTDLSLRFSRKGR